MKAAILTIGDELTCGYRLDTNSQAISQHLSLLPADVALHLSVGDDLALIHRALDVALDLADILIITGGLGPTEDDLTRQAVAAHFDRALMEDAEALRRIQERFARYGRRPLSPALLASNRIQAQVPAGSTVIQNDRGTAAGFYLTVPSPTEPDKHIFATPGIPYEMVGMLEQFILPRLRDLVGANHHVRRAALKLYGLPESGINARIRPLLARERNPLLGLLPHRGTITVEVVAAGEMGEEADALLQADLATLRAEFGRYIISEDERELPQVVADLLTARGLTIATAELGTGGLVAARLSEPEGAERWLRRGLILGAPQEGEQKSGEQKSGEQKSGEQKSGEQKSGEQKSGEQKSKEEIDALTLATDIRQTAAADIGVGIGPLIIPKDSSPDRPYGTLHVAVNLHGRGTSRRLSFNGDRARVQAWAADAALNLVRLWVLEDLAAT